MAKKPSGLGRGLGELLEDNAPVFEGKSGAKVVVRNDTSLERPQKATYVPESKPKNKSLKANYR